MQPGPSARRNDITRAKTVAAPRKLVGDPYEAVERMTGLRVTELTTLRCQDAHLGTGPHVQVTGKGRKHRATPLTSQTVAVLRQWLKERAGQPQQPLFPTSRGRPGSG